MSSTTRALIRLCIAAILLPVILAATVLLSKTRACACEPPALHAAEPTCTEVAAPMTPIPGSAEGEPQLLIPQPAGWERLTAMPDTDYFRLHLVNRGLKANRFTPMLVVTFERIHGVQPADAVLGRSRSVVLAGGASDVRTTAKRVCGHSAEVMEYTYAATGRVPAHPATRLSVAAHLGGDAFLVTVTLHTTEPDHPVYRRDAETILNGFQLLPVAQDPKRHHKIGKPK